MSMHSEEKNHRSLLLLGIILGSLLSMIPALWFFHGLNLWLEGMGMPLVGWLHSLLGFVIAILPGWLLVRSGCRYLNRRYPDSEARSIQEPGQIR